MFSDFIPNIRDVNGVMFKKKLCEITIKYIINNEICKIGSNLY
jgi:hypothetical protein